VISIVVPAFNEERLLSSTLDSISKAAHGLDHELIVCDNNSTDRTAEIARAHGAKVVFEPVNQISRARNAGASAATGDWLVFVDADSTPSRALFEEMVSVMPGCIGGGSTVDLGNARLDVRMWVGLWNATSRGLSWAAGSFIFCRADSFRAIGGFSTDLYAAEEIDLSRRMKKLGRFVILHRNPLRTSDRKAHLYKPREHFAFFLRFILTRGRTLRSREGTHIWYDGRR
jgi:glycosyltransferase involved in cell wall biosynthesis